jgi:propionate CoA-transferase
MIVRAAPRRQEVRKVFERHEAAKLIHNGATVAINGFGPLAQASEFEAALRERFLETGEPKGLTLVCAAGQGIYDRKSYIDQISLDGLFTKVIAGHFRSMLTLADMVAQEKVEGYNLPMGVISQMFREMAGRKPGLVTRVGLKTFVDPRLGGGRLNSISKESYVELMKFGGEEFLFYRAFPIDVALIRGTTADPEGNITMEREAVFLDAFSMAQAAKANGGIVIVQVERLSDKPARPKEVKIPGVLVDAVVVAPEQRQTHFEVFNPHYTGDSHMPESDMPAFMETLKGRGADGQTRSLTHYIIARRAATEVGQDNVVNLGAGVPELVGWHIDPSRNFRLTVESGVLGGVPTNGADFGAAVNPQAIYDQPSQFDFYDGGGLDVTFLGALETDKAGNVNVSRSGNSVVGIGGFVNISQNTRKVVFCFPFSVKGLAVAWRDGKLVIEKEGQIVKFSKEVQQISFSGEYATETGQRVLYVTERCVFELTKDGLTLVEVAPGIDAGTQILPLLPFKVAVAPELKIMDSAFFEGVEV